MNEPNGIVVPSSPFVVEIVREAKSVGFLIVAGKEHEILVLFSDLASAKQYILEKRVPDAMPASFPTQKAFTDFLLHIQKQGTTHFGLHAGLGYLLKTWPIQAYIDAPNE